VRSSSTRCVVGSFRSGRNFSVQHTTGQRQDGRALTGLSERDLRQQLKKSLKAMKFGGGRWSASVGY